jgi:hypothetical protein
VDKAEDATKCGRAVLASMAARHGGDVEKFYQELPAPPDRRRGYSIPEVKSLVRMSVSICRSYSRME